MQEYFSEIHGFGSGNLTKSDFINKVAEAESASILYLDDDPEEIDNQKITVLTNLLPKLSPTKKLGRPDFEGEGGLNFERWQEVLNCLVKGNYRANKSLVLTLVSGTQGNDSDYGFPVFCATPDDKEDYLKNDADININFRVQQLQEPKKVAEK